MIPLAPFLILAVQTAPPAAPSDDAARLLPAETAILVRLESLDAWTALVTTLGPILGEAAGELDLQAEVDALAAEGLDPAERPLLATTLPAYVAVAFDPSEGPSVTFVAPVTNGKPFQLAPEQGAGASLVLGSYAAVTNRPTLAPGEPQHALLARLRPGLVSAHVDLAQIIATFRPLIEMGLEQAEASMYQLPQDGPLDVEPILELYLEGARELLDSVLGLDLVLAHAADELALEFSLVERDERWPELALGDPAALLGCVDPASPLQLAGNVDPVEIYRLMEDLVEAGLAMYPEPLRSDFARMTDLWLELAPLLEPGLAGSAEFGAGGMRGTYVLRSSDPGTVVARLEQLMRTLDREDGIVRVGASEPLVAEGLTARVVPLTLRHEALWGLLEDMAAAEGDVDGPDPAEMQEVEAMLRALYGSEFRVALAHRGDVVLVAFAGDEAELRASLARLRAPEPTSPGMAALLARVEPGALGFAYRFDVGTLMGQMAAQLQALPFPIPDAPALPDAPFAVNTWGALRGGTSTFGVAVSVSELAEFARAMREAGR